MALPPGARVLDVGAGAALLARAVGARGRADLSWTALDASLDCLEPLRRHSRAVAIVDLERCPRLPGGFDAIVAGDVLEHLVDPEAFTARLLAALRPGGELYVSVPNVANVTVRLSLLFGRFEYRERGILDRTHRIFFTRRRLRALLRESGFAIVEESASSLPLHLLVPRSGHRGLALPALLLRGMTRLLPSLLGYQLLARARRPA